MTWLLFAFLTALTESLKDITGKLNLRHVDEFTVTSCMTSFAALILAPLLFFLPTPDLTLRFWILLFGATSLFSWSLILYFRAIRASDLSLSVPLVMYSPLFILFLSPILVGELPTPLGVLGVFLIVIGSYLINIRARHIGWYAPFQALVREPGPRLMLFVALIWSFTANLDKLGLQASSPVFWGVCHTVSTATICTTYTLLKRRPPWHAVKRAAPALALLGVLQAAHVICYMITMGLALVVYGIAMKRASVLITIVIGSYWLKEDGVRERLTGAGIMLGGVIAILLSRQ
ncbi:MAG: DMT family transporter [Bdellovibrionales bacterium]|nr:DMT family transporter [Bdellovibrionales bacterium]